jgi:hypothetical protein
MKKFIVLYHAPAEAMEAMGSATEEQKMEGMKPWFAWKESIGDGLVDFGNPLMGGTRLLPDGSAEASSNEVTGYSIIQADDMEAAKGMLKGHPHLAWTGGCDIEVHEAISM